MRSERAPLRGPQTLGSHPDEQTVWSDSVEPLNLTSTSEKYISSDDEILSGKFRLARKWGEVNKGVRLIFLTSISSFILASCFLLLSTFATNSRRNTLRFIVIGDWGREGTANQSANAALLAQVSADFQPNFIIAAGDNFYPNGLNSTMDPLFERSFMNVYTAPSLQVPWHAVLGNHDYGDGGPYCVNDSMPWPCNRSPLHQLGLGLNERDSRWHCERTFTESFDNGRIQLFFIDTTPFNQTLYTHPVPDWPDYAGGVKNQSWESQLKEIEYRLAESKAEWKIVVGHHPPRSNGEHGENAYLLEHVEPLLVKYGVHSYFSGHDHDLEHIYVQELGLHYFISGAGSDTTPFRTKNNSLYQHPFSGFVSVTIQESWLTVDYYTVENGNKAAYSALVYNKK